MPFQAVLDDPESAPYRPDVSSQAPGVMLDGQRYRSLAAALLAAGEGDVLHLEPGQHRGPVEIDARVALFPAAAGRSVTILSGSSQAVRVGSQGDVLLRGIDLRSTGSHTAGAQAAVMLLGGRLTLEDCTVVAERSAAVFQSGGELTMVDCKLSAETWGVGLQLERAGDTTLQDCVVSVAAEAGLAVRVDGAVLQVVGGTLEASGCSLEAGSGARVTASLAQLKGGGLDVLKEGRVTLSDCELLQSPRAAVTCAGDARLIRCRLIDHPTAARLRGREAVLRLEHVTLVGVPRPILLEDGALKSQVTLVATDFSGSQRP